MSGLVQGTLATVAATTPDATSVLKIAGIVAVVVIPVVLFWTYVIHLPKQGWRSGTVDNGPEALAHRYDTGSLHVRGGAMIGAVGATWPMATIEADRRQATVRIGRVAVIHRDEVEDVVPVRMPSGRWGIRFLTADGRYDPVVFTPGLFTFSRGGLAKILLDLRGLGWPVVAV